MSQNHFTVGFALKCSADAKSLTEQLASRMPALFQAAEAIGTIHYSRFTLLSEKTLLFLGDFDGEFGPLMADLAGQAGRCSISSSSASPIRRPLRWLNVRQVRRMGRRAPAARGESVHRLPEVTAKQIKALAAAAGVTGAGGPAPVPGDPAHQIARLPSSRCNCCSVPRPRHHQGPGHRRHAALCPVHTARGQPDWLLYRVRRVIRQVHRRLHQKYRAGLRSDIQVHQEPSSLSLQKAPPGIHRFRGGCESHAHRVLSGISRLDGPGYPRADRRQQGRERLAMSRDGKTQASAKDGGLLRRSVRPQRP